MDFATHLLSYLCSSQKKMPVGLAILTRRRLKDEIIGVYHLEQYGSSISYKYNCFEVYVLDDDYLLNSDNLFDLIFYAAKKTISLKLSRLLASKGWGKEERKDIFNFHEIKEN